MKYEPIRLKGERVWRTYIGGGMINCLCGGQRTEDNHFPEEWMYSVTKAVNAGREHIEEGICKLDDGSMRTLKEIIESDSENMLGAEHVKKWGVTPGVLIKIIDSKERLTVQVHPDKKKARELFDSQFGKTECWYILDVREGEAERPCIYLGFKEGITREMWIDCFEKQDYDRMLSLLNRIEVKPGETYLVNGGVPHAIGSGCMLIEIQEPTDYTIRVERVTPSGFRIDDRMCHQGLGFERMFDCFTFEGEHEAQIRERFSMKMRDIGEEQGRRYEIVGYKDTPCFGIERLEIDERCQLEGEGTFYCLYILAGKGVLEAESGRREVRRHDQFFVPAKSEIYSLTSAGGGPMVVLKMHGPKTE